ncbi:MAG: zf-HC2 domain-containing protein [Bryobacteraceae bacterium]
MSGCGRAEELTRYLDGTLGLVERRVFEAHAAQCEDCRDQLELWRRLGDLPEATPGPAVRRRFDSALAAETGSRVRAFPEWGKWAAAAAIAVLCFGAGRWSTAAPAAAPLETAELRTEIRSLRKLVALGLLSQDSASERLKGITYASRLREGGDDVIDAMVAALRYDPNVNVRLAANDALARYRDDGRVRRAFLEALLHEESPMMKIALIDSLVEFQERDAGRALARLERTAGENELVKARAASALAQLKEKGIVWQDQ